jgi:hypothetical protein
VQYKDQSSMAGIHASVVSKSQTSTSLYEEFHGSNGSETMTGKHVGGVNCTKKK